MYFKNGDVYLGDWKNNEMEGNCIYIFSFGDRYEGGVFQ